MSTVKSIHLIGVKLTLLDADQLFAFVADAINARTRRLILSGNIYGFNLAFENKWLRDFYEQADVVRLDGEGIRLAARLSGHRLPPRMTWADFGWQLAEFAARRGFSLFLLGSQPDIATQAAAKLSQRYPSLTIAGSRDGYFDKTKTSAENVAVLAQIRSAKPDILIVGYGMPLQERWLIENLSGIEATVIFTGGSALDYLSGRARRAPRWMTDHGLEWLGRLLLEPRRLWRRYLIGNPLFLYRILLERLGPPNNRAPGG